ncbi:MAG: diguanylate cyclase domain-containing protein [Pontibacterium sp.]
MEGRLLNQRFKRRTAIFATFLASAVLFFGAVLLFQLVQLRVFWVNYSLESTQRTKALVQLHRSLGYGGLIHNFKNYLLRQEPYYLERLTDDAEATATVLATYGRFALNESERSALKVVQDTFILYHSRILIVRQDIHERRTAQEVDQRVVVDDQAAIEALNVLQSEYNNFNQRSRKVVQDKINYIVNVLLFGLMSLPLIGLWAYRHIGLFGRLVLYAAEKHKIQRVLKQTENKASRAQQRGERYKHLAYRCALTQIPNRQAFYEAAARALTEAHLQEEKLAILYVDVDDFKQINDRFGHRVGDQVLTEIALRLDTVLRDDDLVARIGGDEFAILIIGQEALQATEQLILRILAALRQPFEEIEGGLKVSCSVGGAIGPDHGCDVDTLLKVADSKMYLVKKGGKDGAMIG